MNIEQIMKEAEKGEAICQLVIGTLYLSGEGMQKDYSQGENRRDLSYSTQAKSLSPKALKSSLKDTTAVWTELSYLY
jgi:hypothetical protein